MEEGFSLLYQTGVVESKISVQELFIENMSILFGVPKFLETALGRGATHLKIKITENKYSAVF